MTTCTEWREELAGHALGGPASVALAAHLASCFACTSALAAWRDQIEHIDAGVREMAASEPPPYLPARVLAAIRNRRRPGWVRSWKIAVAGLAGAAALAVSILSVRARMQAEKSYAAAVQIANWRPPSDVLLQLPGDSLLKEVPRLGEPLFEMKAPARPPKKKGRS